MFGRPGEFTYLECGACGCVQLITPLADTSLYYPSGYYSMRTERRIVFYLKCRWLSYSVFGKDPVGWFLSLMFGKHQLRLWMNEAAIGMDKAILDIGCGNGNLLAMMKSVGFQNLRGVDPYIEKDIYRDGILLQKAAIADVQGTFDCIMLHHSLEHMPNPQEVMQKLHSLLSPGGRVLIRVPIADSYAWRTYGVNWLQLDAPRHHFLFTRKSMGMLAERAGFSIVSAVCDSNSSQFWGSEQYQRGILTRSKTSFAVNPLRSSFSIRDIIKYRREARRLNRQDQGDQIRFVMARCQDARGAPHA